MTTSKTTIKVAHSTAELTMPEVRRTESRTRQNDYRTCTIVPGVYNVARPRFVRRCRKTTPEETKRLSELVLELQAEKDQKKFGELIDELNALLLAKEKRLEPPTK